MGVGKVEGKVRLQALLRVALRAGAAALAIGGFASCSLRPLFDGTYFEQGPTQEELGFIPRGENIALGADVYVSSSLENNLGLVNPDRPSSGTWREYALWIGWVKTAVNDGITATPQTGGAGASSGWCTYSASPDENLPSWVLFDFGRVVGFQTIGLFPRTDKNIGPTSNMPQDFAFYGAASVDPSALTQDSYTGPAPPEPWVRLQVQGDDDGLITHSGSDFPAELAEQVYVLKSLQSFRYVMVYITRAGGDFVQLAEAAVYAP